MCTTQCVVHVCAYKSDLTSKVAECIFHYGSRSNKTLIEAYCKESHFRSNIEFEGDEILLHKRVVRYPGEEGTF